MQYKACLFDLDGTLINSLADLAASMNHALETMNLITFPEERYRYFVGSGVRIMAEKTLAENNAKTQENVEKAVQLFNVHYAKHYSDRTKPYPGISELLCGLKADGIKTAVVSNKPDAFVKEIVRKVFGPSAFQAVLGQRAGIPIKPDPAGALEACRALGSAPGECVFLGDSSVDMQTAVNAGMTPVGALWGFRGREELAAAGAGFLLEKPQNLLQLFN